MYCSNCGYNNPDDAVFCQNCGSKTSSSGGGKNSTDKHSKGAVIGLSVGIGVLAVVLIVLVVFLFGGKSDSDNGGKTGAHKPIETTAESSDSNSGNNYPGTTETVTQKPSEKPSEPVTSASAPSFEDGAYMGSASYEEGLYIAEPAPSRYYNLCFAGNYAFYIDTYDEGIYRCNLDGTGHTRIHDVGVYPGELRSFNDEIYYNGYANGFSSTMPDNKDAAGHSVSGLHWVNKNGKQSRIVEAGVLNSYLFYNGEIVFLDGDKLYSTPLSATENFGSNSVFMTTREDIEVTSIVFIDKYNVYMNIRQADMFKFVAYNVYDEDYVTLADDAAWNVKMYNNKIYFILDRDLYSVNTDGSSKKLIVSNIDEYVLSENKIFFTDMDKRDMYSINSDGSGKTRVVKYMFCRELVARNNKIYFASLKEDGYIYSVTTDGKAIKLEFGSNEGANDISDFLEDGIEYFF